MPELKLGKKDATPDPRDFQLRDFLDVERVNAKPYVPHDKGYKRQMYANGPDPTAPAAIRNTGVGDCELARCSNAIQLMRHTSGKAPARLNGTTAVNAYHEVTGYVIGDESTDQGTDMGESAKWWRKTGMKDLDGNRHAIAAYASFDPSDVAALDAAVRTFDFAGIGIQFPSYAMDEFDAGHGWTYKAGGKIEGGHAINYCAPEKVDTWAREISIGKTFIQHYGDEGLVYVSAEIFDEHQETPEGLDLAALKRAIAAL